MWGCGVAWCGVWYCGGLGGVRLELGIVVKISEMDDGDVVGV